MNTQNERYVIACYQNKRNIWWFCDRYNELYSTPVENVERVVSYEDNIPTKHIIKVGFVNCSFKDWILKS